MAGVVDYFNAFALAPLSVGDIIDRAVRLYRRHFVTLLRIVLAPSLIAYAGGIAWTVGWRNLLLSASDAQMALYITLVILGVVGYLVGKIAFYVLLGGTARALVNYFLDGSPLRAREVYRAVRERLWSLVGATVVVLVLLLAVLSLVYLVVVMTAVVYLLAATWLFQGLPRVQTVSHWVFGGFIGGLVLALLLLIYARVVYVPQALMVEGKGIFSAVGRSITLAGRDIRRIGAILLFEFYVAWSVLLLLAVPLGWYAALKGVDVNPFSAEKPLWYNISSQTLTQLSEILLAPIAMLGFTLLYIDSRVRKEGFDIELLANRYLPPPSFPPVPEVMQATPAPPDRPAHAHLGLDDYRPAPGPRVEPVGETVATVAPVVEVAPAPHIICSGCGFEADPDGRFCGKCGALLPRICPSCGFHADPDGRFCGKCGALIEQELKVEG